MNYLLGIDDAARMPVLGSMFIAGVLMPEDAVAGFEELKTKEERRLTNSEVFYYAEKLREFPFKIVEITAEQINKENMNDLELKAMCEVYCFFESEKPTVFVDNFDKSTKRFIKRAIALKVFDRTMPYWKIQHHADEMYAVVSAASVLAKEKHLHYLESLKKEYGDIGTANPGDPLVGEFLKKYLGKFPPIVRTKYETVQRMIRGEDFKLAKTYETV